jgi:hypothetical protein
MERTASWRRKEAGERLGGGQAEVAAKTEADAVVAEAIVASKSRARGEFQEMDKTNFLNPKRTLAHKCSLLVQSSMSGPPVR